MKIFSAEQIRQWDAYTILHEPVASVDLMERAALACLNWLDQHSFTTGYYHFVVLCGKGNNGGDGLALSRLLLNNHCAVTTYILEFGHKGTGDFQINLERLHGITKDIHFIQDENHFPIFNTQDIIIDALFGTGLSRPLNGIVQSLVSKLNQTGNTVISLDMPSGLATDGSSTGYTAVKADHTLSFQVYKPAFLLAENGEYTGRVHILPIGLHPVYYEQTNAFFELTDEKICKKIYRPRNEFAHKGRFGHAALVAGSTGMMGAAVLSAKACLRSGAGKLTVYIPKTGYEIIQGAVPESMACISGSGDINEAYNPVATHEATGIGPGISTAKENRALLLSVLSSTDKPVVIDADALILLSMDEELQKSIPPHSILTPHPKEFDRLFGETENEWERIQLAVRKAKELKVVIVLKGHHTLIALPEGNPHFNNTGNAGMATAGSGDVLTGMLTGLLAQGYSPADAAILGVYLHGLAGDLAAGKFSEEAMIAGDIINQTGEAFKILASAF